MSSSDAKPVADATAVRLGGPFYEDLAVGQVLSDVPGLTLTDGHAALHQAIIGDRLRLPLDAALAARVLPDGRMPAHPALVLTSRSASRPSRHSV